MSVCGQSSIVLGKNLSVKSFFNKAKMYLTGNLRKLKKKPTQKYILKLCTIRGVQIGK